jgi:hypothetical protein
MHRGQHIKKNIHVFHTLQLLVVVDRCTSAHSVARSRRPVCRLTAHRPGESASYGIAVEIPAPAPPSWISGQKHRLLVMNERSLRSYNGFPETVKRFVCPAFRKQVEILPTEEIFVSLPRMIRLSWQTPRAG